MVKTYYLEELCSSDEIREMEGQFCDENMFHLVIDHDADVYRRDHNGKTHILFYFRKNIIPDSYLKNSIRVFKKDAMKGSSIRGKAGGVVDPKKISSNVVGVVSPGTFKSKVIYENGDVSKYYVSNKVNSLIAGYFDKPKVSEKSAIIKANKIPCRMTAFTENNSDDWKSVLPLIHQVSCLYQKLAPAQYQLQKTLADRVPEYAITGTPFSTLTINLNFQTSIHVDSGDFDKGLSAIIVAEEGKYKGGFLGYPQFGVCVDVRNGDFILKDPHQYHCNTKIKPISKDYTRLSMIFYYRQGISKCGRDSGYLRKKTKVTKSQPNLNQSKVTKVDQPKLNKADQSKLAKTNQFALQLFGGGNSTDLTQPDYIWHEVNPKIKNATIKSVTKLSLLIRPETTDIKVIDEVMVRDVYELKKLDFWIEPQDHWLDLGANIGTFTLMCLARGAQVISYEPEEENFQLLETNVETNFNQGFTLNQKAVGAKNGIVSLYLCKGDYNKYRHTIYPKRGRESVQIPMESIHSVLAKNRQITAIKIDIEGAEIDILESMKLSDWKKTRVKKMVFEYSFDIDPSIPRFLKIVENLRLYFDLVHYTKVKEDEEFYKHFPAMTMVYCLKF